MWARRRLCRALLGVAVALPGAVATLGVAPAVATTTPALTVSVIESCGFVLKSTPMAFRVRVQNHTSAVLPAVSLTPELPEGFTATVEGEPTPLPPLMVRTFTVLVTAGPSVPPGSVILRFHAAAGAESAVTSAVRDVVDVPAAPTDVTAVAGDGVATVSWTAGPPAGLPPRVNEGYDPGPQFVVVASPGGARTTVRDATSAKVAGLTNGTPHTFTVAALNEFGRTESAASAPVVPRGVPDAVPDVAVAGEGAGRTVTWAAAPDNGSPVTGYTVTAEPGGVTVTAGPDARAAELTGLDPTTTYAFAVRAANDAGTGEPGVPNDGRPTSLSGTVRLTVGEGVEVHVDADPAEPPVDGWLVRFEPTGEEVFAERQSESWVPAGYAQAYSAWAELGTTFTVSLRAVNAAGAGPVVRLAPATTAADLPVAPLTLDAVALRESVQLCFAAGADLGADVAGFVVRDYATNEDVVLSPETRVATVTGLAAWQRHDLYVRARYAAGHDTAESPGDSAMPYAGRGGVAVTTSAQSRVVDLMWTHPWQEWGSADAFLEITASPGGAVRYAGSTTESTWIDGLTNGTAYTFTVRVLDENGYQGSSVAGPVTPGGKPGEVPDVSVTPVAGDPTAATVRWSPADPNGSPLLRYGVFADDDAFDPPLGSAPPDATSLVLRDLVAGEWYALFVAAENAYGIGPTTYLRYRAPDATPPVVTVTPLPALALAGTARVTYRATDALPDGITYDVRYRAARHDSGFGPYRYPASWQGTTATTRGVTPMPGTTYCFGVRARDADGNVAAWSPDVCTTTPVDDVQLVASAGWAARSHPETYAGTYSISGRAGATLTLPDARARRLSLVAIRCAVCGEVGVYVGGTLVRRWSLHAPVTAYRQVLSADLGSLRTGDVTLKVLSGRVHVDALAARPV